jgi:hypothetical protein
MDWSIKQVADELVQRVLEGPMQFRFIVQPVTAACLGIRDGLSDFRAGAPQFFPALWHAHERKTSWRTLLRRLRWPVLIATAVDAVVQHIMFGHLRPLSAVLVGTGMMALPYSAARGLANLIRSRRARPRRVQPV